jgi:hypothetical protein
MPDTSRTEGFREANLLGEHVGSIIHTVRFGFGRSDSKEEPLTIYFAQR